MPTVVLLAVVVWLVGSFAIPGRLAGRRRAVSLQPTSVTASAQDRYRLDERANVWANVREHPFTGLGLGVAWSATERPLPLDRPRSYAHFAALYWWMKLGILGALAYLSDAGRGARALVAGLAACRAAPTFERSGSRRSPPSSA